MDPTLEDYALQYLHPHLPGDPLVLLSGLIGPLENGDASTTIEFLQTMTNSPCHQAAEPLIGSRSNVNEHWWGIEDTVCPSDQTFSLCKGAYYISL
jgi:hypothetical protein